MRYLINRYSPTGDPLDTTQKLTHAAYVRVTNAVGGLEVWAPLGAFQYGNFGKCQILELWREKYGVLQLQNETAYFLMNWELKSVGGEKLLHLLAYDANWLLNTRIVNEDAGGSKAEMTDYADDMMKEIVEDHFGATTISGRDLSDYISISGQLGNAPSETKAFSRRKVLAVLQELAKSSTTGGTNLYFDMVRTGVGEFEFRTYTGQRGQDHGLSSEEIRPVGEQYGNFDNVVFGTYHSEEVNAIQAGGQGKEDEREIVEVSDDDRISNGYPWNRVEAFIDARNSKTTAGVTSEANRALREGKPKQVLSGDYQDTDNMQYHRDFGFGDILAAEGFGYHVDCHVDRVKMEYGKAEKVSIKLEGEL